MITAPIPVDAVGGIGGGISDHSVGCLPDRQPGFHSAWPVDRVRRSATGKDGQIVPIDPVLLAGSMAELNGQHPEHDLASTLTQAVVAARQLFMVDAAGVMLADADGKLRSASASDARAQTLEDNQETLDCGPCFEAFTTGRPAVMQDATEEPRWGELTPVLVEFQIRSGLSVPVELGGRPIGTLDVYAVAPGGWDATEISALEAYAGLVATLLGTAAKAEVDGRLADQLKVALDSRTLIERVKGALMERERLDDQQTFIQPGQATGSSRAKLTAPAGAAGYLTPQLDMSALDGDAAAYLEGELGGDGGIGHRLSLLLLGFLETEVVPMASRLADLGIDPTPVLAASSGILRLYADTLERPDLRR